MALSQTRQRPKPTPSIRQVNSERRRQAILEAARRCFAKDGYAGATVSSIAQDAGVSSGLLYRFFENKDELFNAVLRTVVKDWVQAMVHGIEEDSAADALEGMFRRSVQFCRAHPLLPALMADEPKLQLERGRVPTKDRVKPHRDLVAKILKRGVRSGELRKDLDINAAADVICQLQGDYSRRAYAKDPLFPLSQAIIEEAVRMIRTSISR